MNLLWTQLRKTKFVLGDDQLEKILTWAAHPNWIADGTFYVSPKQFYQSYSIHAVIDGKCLPLLFAILSDKTQDTYVFLLNVIKGLLDDIESGIVMLDFELALKLVKLLKNAIFNVPAMKTNYLQ